MIRVEHLTKHYGPRVAVADVTFEVEKGEVLGFLGPNGAGKTTTMRILTGYLPPSGGRAEVAGFDVATQSLQARAHIGYLPETVPLYTDMSVRSYLDFMAKIKGVKERRREVDRAMEKGRIAHRADDQIGKLSKGLRQRVGLAQALLGDPPVLILDEPTSGLDPKQIIETRNLIKSLGGEHTVILSTHILPEVAATCSRIIIISNGRVVAQDTPENLDRRLKGAESIALTVRGPREDVVKALRGVPRVLGVEADAAGRANGSNNYTVQTEVGEDVREALASAVVSAGYGLMELRPAHLSLEEIFLQLTTNEPGRGRGMTNTWAVAVKELRAYFLSPLAYLVTALFLIGAGVLFALILGQGREASLRGVMSNVSVIFLIIIPMISMRLLAEEMRSGTVELLLTSPVHEWQIVTGKFLGGVLLLMVMVGLTLVYAAFLFVWGNPDRGPMGAGYLGIILQASAFLAVGLWASSLTENQIVAAVLSFVFLLVLWLSDNVGQAIGGPVGQAVSYVSVITHFQEFPQGVINLKDVVFFVTMIVGGLVLSTLSLQSRRYR